MINQLVQSISQANIAYRLGKPIMSDTKYDQLVDELRLLDPSNEIFNQKLGWLERPNDW